MPRDILSSQVHVHLLLARRSVFFSTYLSHDILSCLYVRRSDERLAEFYSKGVSVRVGDNEITIT